MEGEKRCFSRLRPNLEILFVVLFCLIAVCQSADARTISQLLSDLDSDDYPQYLPHQLQGASGTEVVADENDYLINLEDDVLPKRAPWAAYEVNVNNLRQKILRSKMFNNRQKYSSNHRDGSTEDSSELPSEEFVEGYIAGWQSAREQLLGDGQREIEGPAERGNDLAGVLRRLDKREDPNQGRTTRPRSSSYPVFLGMGQETANAAYNTFASLRLAEEEKRKNLDNNPVRFIGKRYSTDE